MVKKIIAIVIWLAVLGGLVYYIFAHSQDLAKLLKFSVLDIAALVLLFFLSQFINGLRLKMIMKKSHIKLGTTECFHLANINAMINYLPMKGGAFVVAYYLKSKHTLSYTNFIRLSMAGQLVLFLATAATVIVLLLLHYATTGVLFTRLLWIFVILFLSLLLGTLLLKPIMTIIRPSNRLFKKIKEVLEGLTIVLDDRRLLVKLILASLLSVLFIGLRFAVEFKMISFHVAPVLPFIVGQAKMITTLLSITPSNIGIAELAAGGASEMLSMGLKSGVYAAAIDRIVTVLVLIVMSFVSFIYIGKKKSLVVRK